MRLVEYSNLLQFALAHVLAHVPILLNYVDESSEDDCGTHKRPTCSHPQCPPVPFPTLCQWPFISLHSRVMTLLLLLFFLLLLLGRGVRRTCSMAR